MDCYIYKCPVCGFIYQVPDYWVSFSPADTEEMPHVDLRTGEMCPNASLELQKES